MRTVLLAFVWLTALLLGAVTASANFHYGLLVGHGQERWVYAIGGTVLDVVKTFLPIIMATFLPKDLTAGTFARAAFGWTIWGLAVVWSVTCALGLYALTKDAKVGDTLAVQAEYRQLTADKTKFEGQLAGLVKPSGGLTATTRTAEVVDGEIAALKRDRLWDRTRECTDATATASREFCAKVDGLVAERRMARPAADIRTEFEAAEHTYEADRKRLQGKVAEIDQKLAGMNLAEVFKKADPATEALSKVLGWEPDTLKGRLALLLAVLFECAGLLPWIATGGHGAAPAQRAEDGHGPATALPETPRKRKEKSAATPDISPAEALDLPEVDSLVATWAKVAAVRRKGSFVPASEMGDTFDQWCRANGHEIMSRTAFGKEMTRLGFERSKVGGKQRYADVALIPTGRNLKVVADNDRAGAV